MLTKPKLTAAIRQGGDVYFVGVDLAWGDINQSGVAVIDADGRLLHIGTAQDDSSIEDALAPYVSDECVVAIDAPLIVKNAVGRRRAEVELGADFQRFDAGAHSANSGNPVFAEPRGARLVEQLDLDMDPNSIARRRAIEVYPHPATVSLFRLGRTLKYKKGSVEDRRRELLRLMELIEGLADATPRLRVNHNVAWVELRNRVAAATRQVQLDRAELCAYIGLYWYQRPEDVTIYGDFGTGYIVTPTLPPGLKPTRRAATQPPAADEIATLTREDADELHRRLTRLTALLEDAQHELSAIREWLRRM
jgi:predicted RNase H-like nuclease